MSRILTRRRRGTQARPRFVLPAATVNDTFAAESDGVLLSAHTSDTAGTGGSPSWTIRSGAATTAAILTADHSAKCSSATLSTTYVHNHTPTGAEYTVYCKMKFIALTAGESATFSARGSVASTDRYYVSVAADTGIVSLIKSVTSVDTTLMSWTPSSGPSINDVWELRLECANNEKSVLVKRGSDTEFIRRCYSNDNTLTTTGKAGIGFTKQAMRISQFAIYQAVRPNIRSSITPDAFAPMFAVAGGQGRNGAAAYMYDPIPTNVKIDDTIDQAAFQSELNNKALADRWINYSGFTTKRIIVPDDQALEPVLLRRSNWGGGYTGTNYPPWAHQADQICRAGFPVPTNYVPDAGSDKELCLIQPTYQIPAWQTLSPPLVGRYFEGWIFEANPSYDPTQPKVWPNYAWRCAWPARLCGMNVFPGHFADWNSNTSQSFWPFQGYHATDPTDPNGTFCSVGFGASASGLFLADSEILKSDLDRHAAGAWGLGHTIGLSVPSVGGYRWPAQRSDANLGSSYPLKYGQRVVLPADYVIPGNLHPVCRALVENCILSDDVTKPCYGFVLHEQTNTTVAFKAQPGAQVHWTGVAPNVVLNNFPWNQLLVIATGTDSTPTVIDTAPLAAPSNSVAPSTGGSIIQAQTRIVKRGTWTGTTPITYTYQWQNGPDGSSWSNIASATGTTYLLVAGDVGKVVRCVVTGTSRAGTGSANTAASATITSGTAPFMRDTFTGTDGTLVQSHTGELGATWTKHASSTGSGNGAIQSNRAMGPSTSGTAIYTASATPPSADYQVMGLVSVQTNSATAHLSVEGRMSTSLNTGYCAQYYMGDNTCNLFSVVNGTVTPMGTVSLIPTHSITLKMVGDQISMLVDGSTVLGPYTNTAIAVTGKAGYRHGGANSASTGIHLDNIEAVAL